MRVAVRTDVTRPIFGANQTAKEFREVARKFDCIALRSMYLLSRYTFDYISDSLYFELPRN